MSSSTASQTLNACKKDLEEVNNSGNPLLISSALANLGIALFQNKKFKEGVEKFEEAESLAKNSHDVEHIASVIGKKMLAYQLIGRLPDAYKSADQMLKLGEENLNKGIEVDALASKGQIQLDSGDPITAMQHFHLAQLIANEIDDTRRQMNIFGAIGNCSLTIAVPEEALENFHKAKAIAAKLNDIESEIGFEGNIGTVLALLGRHKEAIRSFESVLTYVCKQENLDAQIQVLMHLVTSNQFLEVDDKVLAYADRGINIAEKGDKEFLLSFHEAKTKAYFRKGNEKLARDEIKSSIEIAEKMKDKSTLVNLLINLGESLTVSGIFDQALEVYRKALEVSQRQSFQRNEAYLVGRIGVTLAEIGQLDEAIEHHERAIDLAHKRNIPELEAEQLVMLAIAYRDKRDFSKAVDFSKKALKIYTENQLQNEVENTNSLLTSFLEEREKAV